LGDYRERMTEVSEERLGGDFLVSISPLYDAAGQMIGSVHVARDITERKRTEEELRRFSEEIQDLYNNAPCGYHSLDKDGVIVRMNDTELRWLGFTRDEVIGQVKLAGILTAESSKTLQEYFPLFKERGYAYDVEFEFVRKDGTVFPGLLSATAVKDKEGNYVMGRSTVYDISERKRAEDEKKRLEIQLHQAQKMEAIGTLAGGIAHDFNNLLTVMTGYGALLNMRMDEADPLRTYVDQILSACEKAGSLTHGLLAFSRQQPIHPNPLGLNNVVKGTEKLLKRLITEDVMLKLGLAREEIIIMADATQIDQILFNLATNARDAMQKGGVLTIETELIQVDDTFIQSHGFGEPGRYALLSISDTGIGMDEKTRSHMFDPFFTTKEVGKGTGLGLSTVYGIVKQHNGYISVQSEPNKGTSLANSTSKCTI
jgi:two-component system cell cycle sensor histidine kinase/response regulator CckA